MTLEARRLLVVEFLSAHWVDLLISLGLMGAAFALVYWLTERGTMNIFQRFRLLINIAPIMIIGAAMLIWLLFGELMVKVTLSAIVIAGGVPFVIYLFATEGK